MGESGSVLSAPVVFEASDKPEVEVRKNKKPFSGYLGFIPQYGKWRWNPQVSSIKTVFFSAKNS